MKPLGKENPAAATDGLLTTRSPSSDLKDHKMSKLNQSHKTPQINLHEAERFLESLGGIQTAYCFQTIPNQVSQRVPRIYFGTFICLLMIAVWRLFKPLQTKLAIRFAGNPKINDLPRLMRLPGFLHTKREPFMSRIV